MSPSPLSECNDELIRVNILQIILFTKKRKPLHQQLIWLGCLKTCYSRQKPRWLKKKKKLFCVINADGLSKVTFTGGLRTVKKLLAATPSGKYLKQFTRISKKESFIFAVATSRSICAAEEELHQYLCKKTKMFQQERVSFG